MWVKSQLFKCQEQPRAHFIDSLSSHGSKSQESKVSLIFYELRVKSHKSKSDDSSYGSWLESTIIVYKIFDIIQVTVRRTADGKREFKFKKMSRDEIEDVTAKKMEKLLGYKYQTKASTL